MKRLIALSVVVGFLSSCATLQDQGKLEGCGIGALGGAAAGALIGLLVDGGRGAAIGAGVGAVGGCATGYVLASQIVKRREQLAGKENDLDARIEYARGLNEDAEAYNKQLAKDVDSVKSKADQLAKQTEQQRQDNKGLVKTREQLQEQVESANTQLAAVEKELQDLKSFRTQNAKVTKGKSSKDLDAEIVALEDKVAKMKSSTTALASQSQRI